MTRAAAISTQTVPIVGFTYNHPSASAVDSHGTIYIADAGNKRVLAVSPDSSQSRVVASGLQDLMSVAVDARGILYIDDLRAGVFSVTPDGHRSTVGHNLEGPIALAARPDGSVYAATPDFGITQIRPDGTQTTVRVKTSW